ncbi:sporulation lipoprotein, YhcN/YlaJ family [Thermoanaerobacterium thermosaccharolyticum]|uniref:Sporulation lipoprotein, YhcN/YlaJ family n=1 Tax=Thermoanaerobacterium thermosaccharolyticum TaxID=1517 RepID=A0A231VI03_THETR|nr:YhcN/YlaJ family sporulation lipoprotein [Thermoanaerobacterium thermosaccharolyticum]AST58713.1 sporulation lipoprotein, YhcN/YlaJ family [Thermoanaerobacterium thermosaccharolyticum]OXT07823.1 sporulation protein [Thermoanaerobacterium thermosaccharolyticum]
MKKTRNILLILLTLIMALSISLTGCKTTKKPSPTRYTPTTPRTTPAPSPGMTTPAPSRTPTTPTPTTPAPVKRPVPQSTRAAKIASNVAKLPEVNRATVVISGNTAIVGIDMKANVQGTHETQVKKKVEKTVRDTDKGIKNVSVTSDPDLYTRINNIAKGIAAGRPLSEFTKQITEILKRITPSA